MLQGKMASSSPVLATVLVVVLVLVGSGAEVAASASDHKYKEKDKVPLYANKIGPFNNPRLVLYVTDKFARPCRVWCFLT